MLKSPFQGRSIKCMYVCNYLSFGESGEQLELDQYLPPSAFTSVNDIVN